MPTNPHIAETLEIAERMIRGNARMIYVREKNAAGKWDSLSLAELPEPRREYYVGRFVERWAWTLSIPVAVKDSPEAPNPWAELEQIKQQVLKKLSLDPEIDA
jgi:hypothetical protein